jgi:Flp pilus assembly protein TadG
MKKAAGIPKIFRLVREERGSELVEFATTAWVLMLLLIGTFEGAYAMYAYHFTTYAAQQGTRFAMVRGYTWSKDLTTNCATTAPPNFTMPYTCTASATDIQNYVRSLATGGINPSSVTINTTGSWIWPGTTPDNTTTNCSTANSQGCMVRVTVNYAFNALPFLSKLNLSISATSEKVIVQ